MKTRSIEIHQNNMFCQKCFNNVILAISKIENIKFLDINMVNKVIKLKYQDNDLNNEEIRYLINNAIV